MMRVWLTPWEWACCGDAFEIGDDVDFGVVARDPDPVLTDALGADLLAGVDAYESHHEEAYASRVRGRVVAVQEVTQEVIERAVTLEPSLVARSDGSAPERMRLPRETVMIEPVPGTALLAPVRGVGLAPARQGAPRRSRVGWLVDVEESSGE
jgi:hypothetical protein